MEDFEAFRSLAEPCAVTRTKGSFHSEWTDTSFLNMGAYINRCFSYITMCDNESIDLICIAPLQNMDGGA